MTIDLIHLFKKSLHADKVSITEFAYYLESYGYDFPWTSEEMRSLWRYASEFASQSAFQTMAVFICLEKALRQALNTSNSRAWKEESALWHALFETENENEHITAWRGFFERQKMSLKEARDYLNKAEKKIIESISNTRKEIAKTGDKETPIAKSLSSACASAELALEAAIGSGKRALKTAA